MTMQTVASAIHTALCTRDPRAKVMATRKVARDWKLGRLSPIFDVAMPDVPGRPDQPELLPPGQMPKRGKGGALIKRIALWHSLAHIEFVAIDLALDMAGRFGEQMGESFVSDFLAVAADEAIHFILLDRHLKLMGSFYGALPAHEGLWSSATETAYDVAARLAIVPMVLEARGLDVTPAAIERVREAGDERGAKILERIFDDEIRHVRFGSQHFIEIATRRGEPTVEMWKSLVSRHFHGSLKPPFNDSARLAAGLSRDLYADLAHR